MTNVLFLCTGNSARSIIAEVLLNALGKGQIQAYSAGSRPVHRVNSAARKVLMAHGYSVAGVKSKSWQKFSGAQATPMDIVITVCDSAAGESCPIWPGAPLRAHWGLPDPASVAGSEDQVDAAFEATYAALNARIVALCALDMKSSGLASEIGYIHNAALERGKEH